MKEEASHIADVAREVRMGAGQRERGVTCRLPVHARMSMSGSVQGAAKVKDGASQLYEKVAGMSHRNCT